MMIVVQNNASGFRPLNACELALVAGGYEGEEVVVLGNPGSGNIDWTSGYSAFGFANSPGQTQFQPGADYCGSAWFDAPDTVYGVDISEACYVHDKNYSPMSNMDRDEADFKLAVDIYKTLVDHGVSQGQASEVAMLYHAGVRLGGVFAYLGQGNGW